jgi:hypothetical protein
MPIADMIASTSNHVHAKVSGGISAVVGGGATAWGATTGEWSAVAIGVAIGLIGGSFAIVSLINDKRIKYLGEQVTWLGKECDRLSGECDQLRSKLKKAIEMADWWEVKAHRVAHLGGVDIGDTGEYGTISDNPITPKG